MKKKCIVAFVTFALVLSCSSKDESDKLRSIATPNFRLHEWGTFTSVSGSDGRLLEGVENDVESLPFFVHSHDPSERMFQGGSKGFAGRPLKGVTVKMETPVIYFYTDQSFDAEVSVGFNGGSISQWYPSRSGGEKVPFRGADPVTNKFVEGAIDFRQPFKGSIQWKVRVEPALADWPARVYHPLETPVWIYPRLPQSALVRSQDGEVEKYLFYRGVGRFGVPISAIFTGDRTVKISNKGVDPVPALMAYELTRDGKVRWQIMQPLATAASIEMNLDVSAPVLAAEARLPIHQAMAKMLMDSGLDRVEADAMILTWQASYFGAPGLRLFWVVPRAFTDLVLPLSVNPQPTSMERVMLGRLEMLSPVWERELVARANEADMATPKQQHPFSYERHWPAYVQRLEQLRPPTSVFNHLMNDKKVEVPSKK